MHRGWIALAVGLLAFVGACGDDDTATPSTTSEPTTTTTTAAATTTTTTIDDDSPPELHTTGDDYVAIYESLTEYANWLGEHPNLEALGEIYQPGSASYAAIEGIIGTLVDNGWRWDGPTARNEDVQVGDQIDARSVTVIAVERSVPATLIDLAGAPVPNPPSSGGSGRVLVQLALGDDGRWRIASTDVLEVFPE